MVQTLRLVMGDQLSRGLSALADADPNADMIVMGELSREATTPRHHKRKIAFLFSAMRHFADDLRADGFSVDYQTFDEEDAKPGFTELVETAISRHKPERVVVTEPSEWRVLEEVRDWIDRFDCPVIICEDDRFIASHERFRAWAEDGRKQLRMEYFYREMRRETGYLMDDEGKPVGGAWNFDADNREPVGQDVAIPERPDFPPDETTKAVLDLVEEHFGDHFGKLDGFAHPVTRADAMKALEAFVADALPDYGTYQDAMKQGEPLLFHSDLSALINCGLLDPRECCEAAIAAYEKGLAPINAVEGFVRQIIGWREYIRGIYALKMPDYAGENRLDAKRALPDFFWTAETGMNCLAQAIGETRDNAYAHHIQRLIVIGNFALLAGLDPKQVQEWFLIVYRDAFEWVEMPNVVGMALHADGGLLASKPYAASGAYINRMSDYCGHCRYKVSHKTGPDACPFNLLYWDFIARNEDHFANNPRMTMIYRSWTRMADDKRAAIRQEAARLLENPDAL